MIRRSFLSFLPAALLTLALAGPLAAVVGCQGCGQGQAPPMTTALPPAPDPLAGKLQAAYGAEASTPHKLVRARQLAAVYRFGAAALSQDPDAATPGALHDRLRAAAKLCLPDDALPGLRRAVADELNAALGRDPAAPLDDAARARAAAEFARVAKILEGVQ